MNQDKEHLRLLAIFHYIVAGLAALFSFFPLLYTTIGAVFIFVARHGTAKPGEELPPEFLGWIFVGLGSFLFLLGITMAICILIAGRCLSHRKRYSFALVMACIECIFIPFGTILGVFAIIVLSRESVKALFEACLRNCRPKVKRPQLEVASVLSYRARGSLTASLGAWMCPSSGAQLFQSGSVDCLYVVRIGSA